jgi:uncharacterized membrane protein YfcA
MPYYYYLIAAAASLIAGIINAIAGNGSSITLAVLMQLLGLPAKEANATIRIGVLAGTVGALPSFYKKGHIHPRRDSLLIICMTLGALIGIFTALKIDNDSFKEIFKYLFIVMLLLALIDTKSWLKKTEDQKRLAAAIIIPLYLLLGFYGGFVQMGIGVFFLFVTVLGARYHIVDAAALKALCIFLYTPAAILIFALNGLIHWDFAIVMALGEWGGGLIGAKIATEKPYAAVFAHRLLVVVLIVAILNAFLNPAA